MERRWKEDYLTSNDELTSQLEVFEMKYLQHVEEREEEKRKMVRCCSSIISYIK